MNFKAMMGAAVSVNLEDVLHDLRPLLVIYNDGRVHRFVGTDTVPPSVDTITGVESKDVVIDPETGVFARLYKPPNVDRVGVIVYFHGGGFCVESATSPLYHNYANPLSFKANMIVVSVNYRIAPENHLPVVYEDSWTALKWVLMSNHKEPWLKDHVDLSRVLLAGDSAGANIAHNMAMRVGKRCNPTLGDFTLKGIVLVHPYFWGKDRIGSEENMVEPTGWFSLPDKVWSVAYPGSSGLDDPQLNPGMDPELGDLGAVKVMVCVAEEDILRDRGFYFKDALLKSGWKGDVFVVQTLGEDHVFHLFKPESPKADDLMNQIVAFLNS